MELKANILRIERLSLSDGKGMRTVVFLRAVPCAVPGVRHRSRSRGSGKSTI